MTFTADTPEGIADSQRERLSRPYYPTLEATDLGRLSSPHLGTVAGVRFYHTTFGGTHDGFAPAATNPDYNDTTCLAGIDPETMSEVVVWRERDAATWAEPAGEPRLMLAVGCVEESFELWGDPDHGAANVDALVRALGPVELKPLAWRREGRLMARARDMGLALPTFDGLGDGFERARLLARHILLPRIRAALPKLTALADRYLPVADVLDREG